MFLEQILNHKRLELPARKLLHPLQALMELLPALPDTRPFKDSLHGASIQLIAEIKKASPSKGLLYPGELIPQVLAIIYEESGAAAISVLTDQKFFQGALKYLRQVKESTQKTPVLRKDFIIDPYQLVEARVFGADAVLLIVAALSATELKSLYREAINLGLMPLVEVHDAAELAIALETGAAVIGINNRSLKNFEVKLETTYQLMKLIPKGTTVVSESGIHNRNDLLGLAGIGVNAVLVGESIMTAADPGIKIKELLGVT